MSNCNVTIENPFTSQGKNRAIVCRAISDFHNTKGLTNKRRSGGERKISASYGDRPIEARKIPSWG